MLMVTVSDFYKLDFSKQKLSSTVRGSRWDGSKQLYRCPAFFSFLFFFLSSQESELLEYIYIYHASHQKPDVQGSSVFNLISKRRIVLF